MITLILALTSTLTTSGDARTAPPQPAVPGQPATFLWADWDGDGLDDAFLLTPGGEAHLMRNRRDGTFEDVTAEAGLEGLAGITAAAWGDYDADGRLDLFVGRASPGDKLYRNAGRARFEPSEIALAHSGGARFAHWQDYDRDGLVDLHVHTDQGDVLYHNHGATMFERVDLPLEARTDVAVIPAARDFADEGLAPAATRSEASSAAPASGRSRSGAPSSRAASSGMSASVGGTTTPIAGGPHGPSAASCFNVPALADQSSSACIEASTIPTLGRLYPLGVNLNVDASGRVGMGTTSPLYKLHVIDAAATGVFGQGGTHGVRGDANLAGAGNRYGGFFTSSGGSNNVGVYGTSTIGVFGNGSGYGVYGETNAGTGNGMFGRAFHASGSTIGVMGEVASTAGRGVKGLQTATSGGAVAVEGEARSSSGTAVLGRNVSSTGDTRGVSGEVSSPNGIAIVGTAPSTASNGAGIIGSVGEATYIAKSGVSGSTDSAESVGVAGYTANGMAGVIGISEATTGSVRGVWGQAQSSAGQGVLGETTGNVVQYFWESAGVQGSASGASTGVYGEQASANGWAIIGRKTGSGASGHGAVFGFLNSDPAMIGGGPVVHYCGVYGASDAANGVGIAGRTLATTGGTACFADCAGDGGTGVRANALGAGNTRGVDAAAWSSTGIAVAGNAMSSTGANIGVRGTTYSSAGNGVRGEYAGSTLADVRAVVGESKPAANWGIGGYFDGGYIGTEMHAESSGVGNRFGSRQYAGGGEGLVFGVWASADDPQNDGEARAVYGEVPMSADGYAGYFQGNVHVNGTLSKSAGSFVIDHPLDPANKTLTHSFVESPDMKNIYDGVVVLDERGNATVALPDWFEALNRDFRYQLTAIGARADVWVEREIDDNQFQISGERPGVKVSWQVTGIRRDAYAEANRLPVEGWKRLEDRGHYMSPQSFGLPAEMGMEAARMARAATAKDADRGQAVVNPLAEAPRPLPVSTALQAASASGETIVRERSLPAQSVKTVSLSTSSRDASVSSQPVSPTSGQNASSQREPARD